MVGVVVGTDAGRLVGGERLSFFRFRAVIVATAEDGVVTTVPIDVVVAKRNSIPT